MSLTVRAAGPTIPKNFANLFAVLPSREFSPVEACAKKIKAWEEENQAAYEICQGLCAHRVSVFEFGASLELARTTQDKKTRKAAQKLARTFAETFYRPMFNLYTASRSTRFKFWILFKLSSIFGTMALANKIEKSLIELDHKLHEDLGISAEAPINEKEALEEVVDAYLAARAGRTYDRDMILLAMKYVLRSEGVVYDFLQEEEEFFEEVDIAYEAITLVSEGKIAGHKTFESLDFYSKVTLIISTKIKGDLLRASLAVDRGKLIRITDPELHDEWFASDAQRQLLRNVVSTSLLLDWYDDIYCPFRKNLINLSKVLEHLKSQHGKDLTYQELGIELRRYIRDLSRELSPEGVSWQALHAEIDRRFSSCEK